MGNLLSRDVQEAVNQLLPYFLSKLGQNTLSGDLLPDSTSQHDLGSRDKYYAYVYADYVKARVVEASEAFMEGVQPNFTRNGSFEQVDSGFTNQPLHWVTSSETATGASVEG